VTRYSVGDQVLIRYGRHQGHKGTILKRQPAEVYEMKGEDGVILFFSGEGLERVKEKVPHPVWPGRSSPITLDRERVGVDDSIVLVGSVAGSGSRFSSEG